MNFGDVRSVVATVAAEPWRVAELVYLLIEARCREGVRWDVCEAYAVEVLSRVPMLPGHVTSVGEVVAWCLECARSAWSLEVMVELSQVLAVAVVVRPVEPPIVHRSFELWTDPSCYLQWEVAKTWNLHLPTRLVITHRLGSTEDEEAVDFDGHRVVVSDELGARWGTAFSTEVGS